MDKKTVVVNCVAGPGAGKTTCAWEMASELKKQGFSCEYVPEYAKELVWDNRLDLLAVLNEQERRINRLIGKVDFVVTDSPLILNALYMSEPKRARHTGTWCIRRQGSITISISL